MKLSIKAPPSYSKEREYIIDILFRIFLGLDCQINIEERSNTLITLDNQNCLILPDILFQYPKEKWLTPDSLPKQPLQVWDASCLGFDCCLTSARIPVIYVYNNETPISFSRGRERITIELPIDILGSAFFMLTRYEEVVKSVRDQRDRFPAYDSLAYQEGFLERPIVNEYLEILWACLKRLWPGLKRKLRQYRPILTHDVDSAACGMNYSLPQFFKACMGDVIKRRSIKLAKRRCMSRLEASRDRYDNDPFNTFDFIMDCSERYNLKSAFYFICGVRPEVKNTHYDPEHPWIKKLIHRINQRGHEIGWHPGYGTYRNFKNAKGEYAQLLKICDELGIDQEQWGGRQHGLQWENPTSWKIWNRLGLAYDTSLNFAECPGFRCGVCYEYPVFDLLKRETLSLKERPLIAMDTSYFSYLKYKADEIHKSYLSLSNNCKLFNGDFVGLWHNNNLISYQQKHSYQKIIKSIQ